MTKQAKKRSKLGKNYLWLFPEPHPRGLKKKVFSGSVKENLEKGEY